MKKRNKAFSVLLLNLCLAAVTGYGILFIYTGLGWPIMLSIFISQFFAAAMSLLLIKGDLK